ncbi:MAG: MFS transporter [Planctomycetes bacterium]|nr:MFS transporter [Planctomycetota bacterium]
MASSTAPDTPRAPLERSLRLSVYEGLCFALMVGLGEVYFVADALRLGASRVEQGLVVALPLFFGSLGPLVALRLLRAFGARKPLVLAASAAQVLALLAIAAADRTGVSSPASLIVLASLYNASGQAVGTAWSSWMGELVPAAQRGRYFARRNRVIYAVTCLGILAGGTTLHHLEPRAALATAAPSFAFALVFGLAALARVASIGLHTAIHEPPYRGPTSPRRVARYFVTPRGAEVWRFLRLVATLQFVVYLASPYFTPFMLGDLGFSYLEFTLVSVWIVVAKVALLPAWGRAVDQLGPRAVLKLDFVLLALIPVPWIWAKGLGWVLLAQGLSGMSWAGYELSAFCLVIEGSYRNVRAHVFALQSVVNGTAQLAGGLLGGLIATAVGSEVRVLFALSAIGRLAVALALPRFLRTLPEHAHAGRREVLWRVIGLRPSGGLSLRALPAEGRESDDA